MAMIFEPDMFSRKSRRHGRRRTTMTTYDKYGYQVTSLGSSSHSTGSEAITHVLRVRPGVVVNFIDVPSSSSLRSRTRTNAYTVKHDTSHKSSRPRETVDEREASWEMTHSPHPRGMQLFDEAASSNSFGMIGAGPPPREQLPIAPRPSPLPPSPPPEMRYSTQLFETHREPSAPIDIPAHPRPSECASQPPSTISSVPDSPPTTHYHQASEYHYAPRHAQIPIDTPIQGSSGENLSRSFDYASNTTHSSGSNSPPSATRTVRFNEDPVQRSPSPVVRRKGWWNRKGDQLWDNDGAYAPAPEHGLYPFDLQNYPEPGLGWMNEDGLQIDMKRRIVRKKPLRSALKKCSSL